MSINIEIPSILHQNSPVTINKGGVLFVIGANGSGKSSLVYHLIKSISEEANPVLISAHRQVWFDDKVIDMSNSEYQNMAKGMLDNAKYLSEFRWKTNDTRQNKLPIIRLKKAVGRRNRLISDLVDMNDFESAKKIEESPIDKINSILMACDIPIQIILDDEDNLSVVNHRYVPPSEYSISELSDGEKNAISISAEIISALSGTLFIIDEPERHLHKSISSPLITQLISIRPDCYFIISTHDISLVSDMDESQVVILKSTQYENDIAVGWDFELLEDPTLVPTDIRKDILGSKKNILFVEGINSSLDIGLYKSIFPEVTIIPKEGCDDVSISVNGIRKNESLSWVNAIGIVDNDNKTPEEINSLKGDKIFTLKVHSIESIFYNPRMIAIFIENYQELLEIKHEALDEIFKKIISVLSNQEKRNDLCTLAVNKKVRWKFNEIIPSHKDGFRNITIDIKAGDIFNDELKYYNETIERKDIQALVERYSIRRTGLLKDIVKILNCPNRKFYETKIIKLVRENENARNLVLEFLDGLDLEFNTDE
ncbi:AAA family ATPase [Providencia sp.]|uniref:AAA family ATPase n=1 Tax=Providencia sp. TaxID=589 RepID=UPI00333FFB95